MKLGIVALLVWCTLALVPAAAQPAGGSLASLLDPDQHLSEARSLFDSNAVEAARHLQVALERAPVGSPAWSSAHELAMERRPDLFAQTLLGYNFSLPLALFPEDESLYAPDEVFHVPPYGPQLEFLDKDRRETIRFHLKNGRPLDAAHVIENFLDEKRNHVPGLLLAGIHYERFGELALAEKRYQEAFEKSRGVDSQATFAALFGIIRTKYRRQDFKVAETLIERYLKEAQAHLADVLERVRTSGARDSLYWSVLDGRRHLVEGFNAMGVLQALRRNYTNALYYFEQASLLAPGSIVVALNHAQMLQRQLHAGTSRQIHTKIAESLSGLERALLAQLDRGIDEGALDLGMPLTFRDLLRSLVARVRVRQALFERTVGETKAARGFLHDAVNLTDRFALPHYFLGVDLKAADQLDEALVEFKKALALAPPSKLRSEAKKRVDEVFEVQALRAQWKRTREDQIKASLEEKLDSAPLQALRRDLADGLQMLERGEFPKAREHFLRLSEYHKDSVDVFRWLGYANEEMSRFKEALVAYDRALALDKADPWALSQKAICMYEYVGDLPNGLALAGEAARIKGDDAIILSNLGWLHVMAGELRRGIEILFDAIERSPKDPRHHYRLAMAYYNLGVYPFAEAKFSDVLKLAPKHPRANVFLGLAHARLGKTSEAIARLSQAIELLKDNPDLASMVKNNLALLRGGSVPAGTPGPRGSSDPRLPLTREEVARVVAANTALTRARELVVKGELTAARELLASAHNDFPTAIELSLAYAFVLLTGRPAVDLAKPREVVSGILDLNPQDIRAHHLLAHIQLMQGAVGEFTDSMRKFGRLPPGLVMSEFLDAVGKRWAQVLDVDRNDESAVDSFGLVELLQGRLEPAQETLARSKTAQGKTLLGEVHLRQFFLDRKQLTFQQAKQAFSEAAYPQVDQLDHVWKEVTNPTVAPGERVAVKPPPAQPARDEEGWWRISPDTKTLARDNTDRVGHIDVNNTLLGNRRWSQIDRAMRRKLEQQEAAKNRDRAEREREEREQKERDEQERIRSNVGGPEKAKTVPPPAPGLPQPAGALIVDGENPPPRNQLKALASQHMRAGLELVSSGRLAEAVREFKSAVTFAPQESEPLVTLALSLVIAGEKEKARMIVRSKRRHMLGAVASLVEGHVAWQDRDVTGAEQAFARAAVELAAHPPVKAPPPKKKRQKKGAREPQPRSADDELAFLTVSRKAWQETLVDNPSDLDANLNVALLDFFAGRAQASLKRLDRLTRTPEGAQAYAEITLFLSQTRPNPALLRKAVEILGSVGGSGDLLALQKELSERLGGLSSSR